MAARGSSKDQYANYAAVTVTETSANTLTFGQLNLGGQLFERRAMIIHQIQYSFSDADWQLLVDNQDNLVFGLSTSNSITSIAFNNPNIPDINVVRVADFGTPGSAHLWLEPITKDYTALPGGGIILPIYPLYAFVRGADLASASSLIARLYYTVKELRADEFVELVEAMRIIT